MTDKCEIGKDLEGSSYLLTKLLSWHLEGIRKITKICQKSMCLGRDSDWAPPRYKSEALPMCQSTRFRNLLHIKSAFYISIVWHCLQYAVCPESSRTFFYNIFGHACHWVSLITFKVLPSCIDAPLPTPLPLLETVLVCLFGIARSSVCKFSVISCLKSSSFLSGFQFGK
jgi:hypothetical protein